MRAGLSFNDTVSAVPVTLTPVCWCLRPGVDCFRHFLERGSGAKGVVRSNQRRLEERYPRFNLKP